MSDTIWEIKECLENALNEQMEHGLSTLNADEAGKVTDMIKDLAEAAMYSSKACYYKTVTDAMHKETEHSSSGETWGYVDHMNSVKEMFKTADPAMKKQMRADVAKLLAEMPS